MIKLTLFLVLTFLCIEAKSQDFKKIKLLDITENSKINISAFQYLQGIDRGSRALDSVFKPIKGNDRVLRYIIQDSMILVGGPDQKLAYVELILIIQIDNADKINLVFSSNIFVY